MVFLTAEGLASGALTTISSLQSAATPGCPIASRFLLDSKLPFAQVMRGLPGLPCNRWRSLELYYEWHDELQLVYSERYWLCCYPI